MYMVGGGNGRVHRSDKPYPGATRFMAPSMPKPPIDWWGIISNITGGLLYFGSVALLCYVLLIAYG